MPSTMQEIRSYLIREIAETTDVDTVPAADIADVAIDGALSAAEPFGGCPIELRDRRYDAARDALLVAFGEMEPDEASAIADEIARHLYAEGV